MQSPTAHKLPFLITIDTEGDNLWSLPQTITTRNASFLPRFQSLCERYGLRPSYLTNWEMVNSAAFREFGQDVLRRDTAEIGMHLHAWNSPPLSNFEANNPQRQACLIESPPALMREKISNLTDILEGVFSVKMISHRAGRWGMNETYSRLLVEHGYLVDCSVTPDVHWQYQYVDGTSFEVDYRGFPEQAYWLNLDNIRKSGEPPLLEVPMTVMPGCERWWANALRRIARPVAVTRRVVDRLLPKHHWFRPFRGNVRRLPHMLEEVIADGRDYIEFMIHSSELMPGGSPSFPTGDSIEQLYDRLEELFERAHDRFVGMTLAEYRADFVRRQVARAENATALLSASQGA